MNEINLINNNAAFRSVKTIEDIATVWGVALTMPEAYGDIAARGDHLTALYRDTSTPNLTTLVTDHPVKNWEEELQKLAAQEARNHIIRDGYDQASRELTQRLTWELNSPNTYDHIINQLPVEEVQQDFIEATLTLGPRVFNIGEAVDFNPTAVQTFREAGRKLLVLQGLNNTKVKYFTSSMFAQPIETMPELVSINGEAQYTQDDLERNHRIGRARAGVKDRGQYITELALGRRPGLRLQVAQDWKEIMERDHMFSTSGQVTRR